MLLLAAGIVPPVAMQDGTIATNKPMFPSTVFAPPPQSNFGTVLSITEVKGGLGQASEISDER